MQAALKAAGDLPVYWINVQADRVWETANNKLLKQMAKKDKQLKIIDWHKASAGKSSWFYSDNIHPKGAGEVNYASLVANHLTGFED